MGKPPPEKDGPANPVVMLSDDEDEVIRFAFDVVPAGGVVLALDSLRLLVVLSGLVFGVLVLLVLAGVVGCGDVWFNVWFWCWCVFFMGFCRWC